MFQVYRSVTRDSARDGEAAVRERGRKKKVNFFCQLETKENPPLSTRSERMVEDVNKSAQTCFLQTEMGRKRDGTGPPYQRKAAAIAATENIRVK